MDAVREFANKGGLVTTGDDAGYIYSMYGFGISRELELHEEAGFHPLEVIEHATWNGARLLGMEDRIGKVREGFIADLLVVNGNPLENLKLLNPYGADVMTINGRQASNYSPLGPDDKVQAARGGGIEWTIKDGIPYHVPTLMREVKEMVSRARAQRVHSTAGPSRIEQKPALRSLRSRGKTTMTPAPSLDVTAIIAAPPARVLKAFFDADALGAWWQVAHAVTTPRILGPYAIEWPPTDFRDEVLGRLGGVFRGTVVQFQIGAGLLRRRRVLAAARRRADRADGARGHAAGRARPAPRACASPRPASKRACAGGATTR